MAGDKKNSCNNKRQADHCDYSETFSDGMEPVEIANEDKDAESQSNDCQNNAANKLISPGHKKD